MSTVRQRRGADFLIEETAAAEVLIPEDMDQEQRMMMTAIRDFAEKEVVPQMARVEARDYSVVRPLFKKAADLGIFMAEVPEEYGGLGLSVLSIAGMNESRCYLGSMASTVFAHQGIGSLPLINFGTKAQIDQYLDKCMNGEIMAAFALTEPSSGSDAMNIKTTAVLNAERTHYVVNGSKQFITNAGWADLFILFAKINGDQFTAFLLERNSPGLSVGENEKLLGLRGSSVCGLALDNVKIPVENVLGEIGKGHKVALCTLNLGRLKMSANCAGSAKKVLECAAQYAAERQQFGTPIAEFGLIQQKIAEMAARAYAAESVAYRTAGLVYQAIESAGDEAKHSIDVKLKALAEFSIECALAKVHGAETYNALADEALQIHGGYGFTEEYKPAQYYRDSRITRIYEGTSEICRNTAAKTILRRMQGEHDGFAAAVFATQPGSQLDSSEGRGDTLGDRIEQIADFKRIFRYALARVLDHFGPEGVLDKDKQQYLGFLADIAIEIYAAESTALRVLKLQKTISEEQSSTAEALAQLYFERAADRIRDAATEILAGIYGGEELRVQLDVLQRWLPLPGPRVQRRGFIAKKIVEAGGRLPDFR